MFRNSLFLVLFLFVQLTCAPRSRAQVIDYIIDNSFDSELLFNRGTAGRILQTSDDQYFVMGMFMGLQSPISTGSIVDQTGMLVIANVAAGQEIQEYKNDYIRIGTDIQRFSISSGLIDEFMFEYRKPSYSGSITTKIWNGLILPNDDIVVAGRFFTDTNTSIGSLRQLCVVDSLGTPLAGYTSIHCGQPIDAEIWTVDSLSDGSLIIAGRFSEVNGHVCNNIARVLPDFTIDINFGNIFNSQGTIFVNYIDSDDRIWVIGPNAQLAEQPEIHLGIARLLPNGLLDTSFNIPELLSFDEAGNENIAFGNSVLEDSDNTFVIVGDFESYNGISKKGITKINDNGTVVSGVFENWGADEAVWGSWSNNPLVGGVNRVDDGKILLGGRFSSFGGQPYSCVVRLQPSEPVNTKDGSAESFMQLYPNPSSEQLTINAEGREDSKFTISNAIGLEVFAGTLLNSSFVVDISGYQPGLYIVHFGESNSVMKFIKTH